MITLPPNRNTHPMRETEASRTVYPMRNHLVAITVVKDKDSSSVLWKTWTERTTNHTITCPGLLNYASPSHPALVLPLFNPEPHVSTLKMSWDVSSLSLQCCHIDEIPFLSDHYYFSTWDFLGKWSNLICWNLPELAMATVSISYVIRIQWDRYRVQESSVVSADNKNIVEMMQLILPTSQNMD